MISLNLLCGRHSRTTFSILFFFFQDLFDESFNLHRKYQRISNTIYVGIFLVMGLSEILLCVWASLKLAFLFPYDIKAWYIQVLWDELLIPNVFLTTEALAFAFEEIGSQYQVILYCLVAIYNFLESSSLCLLLFNFGDRYNIKSGANSNFSGIVRSTVEIWVEMLLRPLRFLLRDSTFVERVRTDIAVRFSRL